MDDTTGIAIAAATPIMTVAPVTPTPAVVAAMPVVAPAVAVAPTTVTPVTMAAPGSNLRPDIEKLVAKFKALDVVTPEMATQFDAYLTAGEADLPKIHETLMTAATEIDRIEAEATAEEQKLLAEYMSEMKLIEKEAKKITLEFEEAVDKDADEAKEAQLLEEVNKV